MQNNDDFKSDLENLERLFRADKKQIYDETERVLNIASNASSILDSIDDEFEQKTSLSGTDIKILMLATALQCVKRCLIPKLGDTIDNSKRTDAATGDKNVESEKTEYGKTHNDWGKLKEHRYRNWQDIVFSTVPYDTTCKASDFGIRMEGQYHRYKTLGHDPVLGWFFGVLNIITDTITFTDFSSRWAVKQMPNGRWARQISDSVSLGEILYHTKCSLEEDKMRLPAAFFAQRMHLKSDVFTKLGLPVPLLGVFSPELAGDLYRSNYDSMCLLKDVGKVGASAMLSVLINMLIGFLHGLFYDERIHFDRKLYEVRSRKIILYSNLIATSSNVLEVVMRGCLGDEKSWKSLDIGGFLVTLHRFWNDPVFIQNIKQEFVSEQFINLIKKGES